MNENKRNRRRFLADLLFAGTAMSGMAFLSQSVQSETPKPSATPKPGEKTPPRNKPVPPKDVPFHPPHTAGLPLPPKPPATPTPRPSN